MGEVPGDWTYHGIDGGDDEAHILVEEMESGPTERQDVTVLRELLPQPGEGGFLWGYTGGGPTRAAAAILADALDLPGPGPGEFHGTRMLDDPVWVGLRNDSAPMCCPSSALSGGHAAARSCDGRAAGTPGRV
jgi:hypothetical protein